MTIEKESNKEINDEKVTTKRVDYRIMNEMLSKVEWKLQDVQEDIHNVETSSVCELVTNIKKAEHLATTTKTKKWKCITIPKDLKEGQREKMMRAEKDREKSHIHEKLIYKEESRIYNEMCKENYF